MNIKARCGRSNATGYKYYGAKNVSICEIWECDFKLFYDYMIMMCKFYGCEILQGNNKIVLINSWSQRGDDEYLMESQKVTPTQNNKRK